VIHGFYLRSTIPVTNEKEFSLTIDRIWAKYFNGLEEKVNKKKRQKMGNRTENV
jgi:hypothetical protein